MISFKGRHFQQEMILQSVRWYLAYSLSYRDIEEIMDERGFDVDHSTLQRWVVEYAPQLEKAFRRKKKRPGDRWRLDETYIKVKGTWKYFYRAVDKEGNTIDFLLTAKRDKKAALRFLTKAIECNGNGLINIDKSEANKAAIQGYNHEHHKRIAANPSTSTTLLNRIIGALNDVVERCRGSRVFTPHRRRSPELN
jgi:transposase-like protein